MQIIIGLTISYMAYLARVLKYAKKSSDTWGNLQDHVFNLKQTLNGFVPDFSNSLQPSGIVESFQPHFRLNQFSIFPGLMRTNTKAWKVKLLNTMGAH